MDRPLIAAALRSALFALAFYPTTLAFVLAGMAASLVGDRPLRAVVRGWADAHHLLLRRIIGLRFDVVGRVPPGAVLIALKHQAMIETVEVLRLARSPAVVVKRELVEIPLFGWLTRRYGVIPVDRQAGARALRGLLAAGRAARAEGRPLAIFPEGTRVAPGSTPPLQAGFAALYRALGLPVIPVALDSGRLWPRGPVKRGGIVRVVIGRPIPPGLPRAEIEARVHAAINLLERPPVSD